MGTCGVGRFVSRSFAFVSAVVLLLLFCVSSALALEPPRPGELGKYRADGTLAARQAFAEKLGNDRLAPGLAARLKTKAILESAGVDASVFLPPSGWRGMPTKGNVKILTLLIDFNDYPAINSSASIQSRIFGSGVAGDFPYNSLTEYYARSSYNQLNIGGNVLGWYRAGNRSAVTQTDAGREALIKTALKSYEATHDFSQYDNDGNGVIDYFVVVWTGPDTGWSGFWWGYQPRNEDQTVTLDGKTLNTYSWQWECRYSGGSPTTGVYDQIVVLHETGHALGLPDYYDYDDTVGPDGGVGGLDMMDSAWGDHNAFSKWILDWITPQVVTGAPQSVTLAASGTSDQALLVMPGASSSSPFTEYFMVQNRQRVGNDSNCSNIPDQNMPNDGLLIWHLDAQLTSRSWGDDYLYDNSYTSHKLLRLMEADGLEEIQTSSAWADAGDYYNTGKTFTGSTAPNSKKYNGSASNVSVTGISNPGLLMTFQAGASDAPPGAPTVSSFAPTSGPVGTSVTITGTNLSGVSAVRFNGTAATSFTPVGATQVMATVPTAATSGTISVTTANGTGFSAGSFTVTGSPPSGDDDDIPGVAIPASPFTGSLSNVTDRDDVFSVRLGAGDTLKASLTGAAGTDFDLYLYPPGTATVRIEGGTVASAVSASYPDAFIYTPTQSGTYYLDVYAFSGAGAGAYTVTYSVAPAAKARITKLSPTSAKRGVTVTITGTGFGKTRGSSSVKWGTIACTKYVSWSATQIKCKVPATAKYGAVKVTVKTSAGTSNAKSFTVRR
jgi:M6 family metalloprotease-like protein